MGCYVKRLEERVGLDEFGRMHRWPAGIQFMCGRDLDEPHCFGCADFGDYLCDYPVGEGKTCDRPMCERHRNNVAPELDYCPTHYAEWEQFKATGYPQRHFMNVVPFAHERGES